MKRLLPLLVLATAAFAADKNSALDRFMQAPDPSFRYELVKTIPGEGYTAYVLDLTSQAWRGAVRHQPPDLETLAHRDQAG